MAPVIVFFQQSLRRLTLKHSAVLRLSVRSVRIPYRDLHMHPFKMMVTQILRERDFDTHRSAYEKILQSIYPGALFSSLDEAHFHLSGTINKANFRNWATETPRGDQSAT